MIEKHQLKGKKAEAGQWFRYLYHLPNADKLSFCDSHALYRSRWQIEELFREIKQDFWRGPFETL